MDFTLLAISVSIDALGIGLSYGMRKSKIPLILNILIGFIVFSMCLIGFLIGNVLSMFFNDFILTLLGSFLLLILGSQIIIKEIIKNREIKRRNIKYEGNEIYNLDEITFKDAIMLAMAISMDAMAAGISASLIGIKTMFFPILVMVAHVIFLNLGMFFGKNVKNISNIPQNLWSIISGILLILIASVKLLNG